MLLEKSEEITPEKMKKLSQSENNTQLWIWLVIEVKSNAVGGIVTYFSQGLGAMGAAATGNVAGALNGVISAYGGLKTPDYHS